MPSDISRKLFNKKKHYSGVISQQGRVSLDADLNEQLDIQQYRTHTETKDVIGISGVPKKNNGFKIEPSVDGTTLLISSGRIYADGLLCELEEPATYHNQPYYPEPDTNFFSLSSPPESPLSSPPSASHLHIADGNYIVYLDAWQREINFLDDALIQEVALGEADTTTRLKTVWQIKLLDLGENIPNPVSCKTPIKKWDELVAAASGKLKAKTNKNVVLNDPCSMKPGSGFRGLENQLYRVEIHHGGSLSNATFKWSRNNSFFETKIESINGSTIKVATTGKDDVMSFAHGQWVELIDEISVLHNEPHPLLKIADIDPSTREIIVNNSVTQYSNKPNLKLRSWDQAGNIGTENGINVNTSDWIGLEDGVEVNFFIDPKELTATYKPGDYWLIPARTATTEIEWPPFIAGASPAAEPPVGVKHFYTRLALLKAKDGLVVIEDCRQLFPSLTDICAEDICFKNDNCDLSQAENVQEALDLLCAANDLRDHNKHMHGYGVVCGLKVKCGANREFVMIENGYALDCDGNIIRLNRKTDTAYSVVAEAATASLLDETGRGKVWLSIFYQGKNEPQIKIEEYKPKSFWDEVLEGSLIKDFFNEAIKPLVDFVKKQVTFPLTDEPPVPIGQQRLTALINLLFQQINSTSGPYIFLSGNQKRIGDCNQKPEEKQNEDQLLFCLYKELKELLSSKTFCAMFDIDRPFPDYKIDPGLDTIFGPTLKFHQRLRIHPTGKFAYTCGKDNKIYVYNLQKLQLHQTLVFPSSPNIKLQDIAVSPNGKELYAIGLLDDKDTVLAMVSINAAGNHSWVNGSSVKCAFKYVSLAMHANLGLYAVARGKGLYSLTGIGTPGFSENPILTTATPTPNTLNPSGLILIPDDGKNIAYVAHNNNAAITDPTTFNRIVAIDLHGKSIIKSYISDGIDSSDDILVDKKNIYITGTVGSQRVLKGFDIPTAAQAFTTNLEASSTLRLATVAAGDFEYILVTLSDKYKAVRVNLKTKLQDLKFRIPVQLFPVAMTINPKPEFVYVLNSLVNTITVVNIEKAFKSSAPNFTEEPPHDIADYHDDVIAAFKDLMTHFVQYLKDVFCDQFLIDCPTCNEKDRVYLGSVEIRGNKVFKICNFSKRKYVKTFRTWGYWLSTVPILPAIKKSFAEFCCKIIDEKKWN
jgi:WD40 repeat protein